MAYDVNGNIIQDLSGSEQARLTLRRNNPVYVKQMLDIGRTYIGQNLTYGQVTPFDRTSGPVYATIDCSCFVGLCLMGISYEDSPYTTGTQRAHEEWVANPDCPWAISILQYRKSTYANGSAADQYIRNAAAIARWYYDRNCVVPMTDGLLDVQPGDILFYAKKKADGTWSMPDRWRQISHVEFCSGVEPAPDTYVDKDGITRAWNKTKYPLKHAILGVRGGTSPANETHWIEEYQEDISDVTHNNVNTLVMIARPDLGALAGEAAEVEV